ncbi:MAG: ADP-ribose-binding protein, partial [Thermoprotei archaeon]
MVVFSLRNIEVSVIKGDITEVEADAIVNAANSFLKHGGGVALAIVRKGGYIIQKESDEYVRKHGIVPEGGVAVTGAGKLKAKYVIHAVGPVYGDPEGDKKLYSAFKSALLKAEELKLKSVALPAISTGVFGYPYERCAEILVKVLEDFDPIARNVKRVIICLYMEKAYKV